MATQPDNLGYSLLDAQLAKAYSEWPKFISTAPGVAYAYFPDYRRTRPDLVHTAARIEDLNPGAGFSGARLASAISADRRTVGEGPYYLLGPLRGCVPSTDGGLATDLELRVLGNDDRPIERLYAAGSNGQTGLLLMGHGHHIAWAFVSGRMAGRNAARSPLR